MRLVKQNGTSSIVVDNVGPLFSVLHCKDSTKWSACKVKALAPAELARRRQEAGAPAAPPSIGLVRSGPIDTLVAHAAKHAFVGMTTPDMTRLMRDLGMIFASAAVRPTREFDVLRTLLEHLFPAMPSDQIEGIMQKRGKPRREQHVTALAEKDALQVTGDLLDEGDRKEARDTVAKTSRSTTAQSTSGSSSASSGSTTKKKALPSLEKGSHCFTIKQVSRLIPKVKGCRAWPGDAYTKRWRVSYPKPSPHAGSSKCFAGDLSEQAAILFCIDWVWKTHLHFNPGEQCPWDVPDWRNVH